ncbi:hypothetical protein C8R43DRAFT_1110473 [Mycena crocata]|nr:hypothetical protein C8R43DRAFT_1110473 [Mycena crocata]
MHILTLSALRAFFAACTATPAKIIARDDPYASVTTTIPGLARPTSTASAVVKAYATVAKACGPDVDAAFQAVFPNYWVVAGFSGPDSVNITDPGFRSWANTQPLVSTANADCSISRNNLAVAEFNDNSPASPTATSVSVTHADSDSPTESSAAPTGTAGAPSSGSATGSSTNDAISGRPTFFVVNLLWGLAVIWA